MLQNRPPIVVILGHVDHGKTTLLDYLRHSHLADREAGGITQYIRSFQLTTTNQSLITFIDTPGHAAFSAMRSRGSRIADMAILVVAANDGVMPQTKESIDFIKAAQIPFIVALTKSDLPNLDPDKVKTQLTQVQVVVEDFGGDVPCVSVSAKTGVGIPELLELIDLITQLHPPQADPEGPAEAVVLESRLDPQKGPLAVCVIKTGTLSVGANLFQQQSIGKARALINSDGQNINSAPPSTPIEIIGLTAVPAVGSLLFIQPNNSSPLASPVSAPTSVPPKINLVLRADVVGSLEAITASLPPEVHLLTSGTGEVTDNDILLAKTSQGQVFSFNAKISASVAKLAEVEHVQIKTYKIIYELLEDLAKSLIPAPLPLVLGRATIAADFKINSDRVAGCRCLEGQITKGDQLRLLRGDKEIGQTRLKSLQIGKNSIDKVKAGQEFGAIFAPYLDFKSGDIIMAIKSQPTIG